MSIFSNTIFKSVSNYIKFGNQNISIQAGANVLDKLPLCNVKIDYKQYQKTMVTIPPAQKDYLLSFPMMGIKSTFIAIKATYKTNNPTRNFLKWKFTASNDTQKSMTSILVFTGTASNPIESILLDNPDEKCSVDLEILISGVDNDYLEDVSAFLYLDELKFDSVQTFEQTNSEILAFYNKDDELVATTDTGDIVNWYKIPNVNRIIIDESSNSNIILDFKTSYDALQTLSAINWLMLDPSNRSLPTVPDTTPPYIDLNANTLTLDLNLYNHKVYTKELFISDTISSIIDTIDGPMIAIPQNIKFYNSNNVELLNISSGGDFTGVITVSDIAGNISTETVLITAAYNLLDTTPPIIYYNSNVNTNTNEIDSIVLANVYAYTKSDAILNCVSNIIDTFDGNIPITNIIVRFYESDNSTEIIIPTITTIGTYHIEFEISDNSGNTLVDNFKIEII